MRRPDLIYLDNASTSYPKPSAVLLAVGDALENLGASPGRGGYERARMADRLVYETRLMASRLFNAPDPARVIFTPGCTYSLNMALRGFLADGDHVIVTGRQHNAVMRPLEALEGRVTVSRFCWDGNRPLREEDFASLLTPRTRAVIVNHASNVDGLLYPLEAIGNIAKRFGLAMIVDVAQTAGMVDIDMIRDRVDILCVPAHKALWGIAGTGLLALGAGVDIEPLIHGGTGSFSESRAMPSAYPDRLEPGSMSLAGIAALNAGMKEVLRIGPREIMSAKMLLARIAYDGLRSVGGVRLFWPGNDAVRIPVFSFLLDRLDSSEVGAILDEKYNIACRVGLHCAADAHDEIGSFPAGAVRFAPGYFTGEKEVARFVTVVAELASGK
jgi:cysteine desulfurase family protein